MDSADQGNQYFNYNNYNVNQGMEMDGVTYPQGMVNQPANPQGMFMQAANSQEIGNQPGNSQGTFMQADNLQGIGNQPGNSQGTFMQADNLQGLGNQPGNSQGMFMQAANLQGIGNQPGNSQGTFMQADNHQGIGNQPGNSQGTFMQAANLQGIGNQPGNSQGTFMQAANPLGMANHPGNSQGMFMQAANPLGMANQTENPRELGGFPGVTEEALQRAGLATSFPYPPPSFPPPPYSGQQGTSFMSSGSSQNMNIQNMCDEKNQKKPLRVNDPNYSENYYVPSNQSNLTTINCSNQDNSSFQEIKNSVFEGTGNNYTSGTNEQINLQPPPSYSQNPYYNNQTFHPTPMFNQPSLAFINNTHQQANQAVTPYFNQQINQSHLLGQNPNHRQFNQALFPQLSQSSGAVTQAYPPHSQTQLPATPSIYYPSNTNLQKLMQNAQPSYRSNQRFSYPPTPEMKLFLSKQRPSNLAFNYNAQSPFASAPPTRLNQPIHRTAPRSIYSVDLTNERYSPPKSPTRGRKYRVRNLTNFRRPEPLRRNERERTPFPTRKSERGSTPIPTQAPKRTEKEASFPPAGPSIRSLSFPPPYRSEQSSWVEKGATAVSGAQSKKFEREGTSFPTRKAMREGPSHLSQRTEKDETSLYSLLPQKNDTSLNAFLPYQTDRELAQHSVLPPQRADQDEGLITSLPPQRTDRELTPLSTLPPQWTDRDERIITSLALQRTDRKLTSLSTLPNQMTDQDEGLITSLTPQKTSRDETFLPPQESEVVKSLGTPSSCASKRSTLAETQPQDKILKSKEEITVITKATSINASQDPKSDGWQNEQSMKNHNSKETLSKGMQDLVSSQEPEKTPQPSVSEFYKKWKRAQKKMKKIIGPCMNTCIDTRCLDLISRYQHLEKCKMWLESVCQDCEVTMGLVDHWKTCVDLSCENIVCNNPHREDLSLETLLEIAINLNKKDGTKSGSKEVIWEDAINFIKEDEVKNFFQKK